MIFIKADFYKPTITKGPYQEDIITLERQFSTGVKTKTVTFKDKLAAQQNISDVSILLFARKNPNTMSIQNNWVVEVQGTRFEVNGMDDNFNNRSEIVIYCDRVNNEPV